MRFVPLVCLATAIGIPAAAFADSDKSSVESRQADVDDANAVEFGIGAQVRRSRVSVRMQKLFLDDSPGPAEQDGAGIMFVRRAKQIDVVFGFGYDPIHAQEGYYLSKGGDPLVSGDADLVELDNKITWWTFDVSFIGRAKLHKILSMRFGAGVGLGLIRGHGYRTSAICTGSHLQSDCTTDPMGERQHEEIDVPVFPVLNVIAGFELRPTRWFALTIDAGLHTAPYLGVGLTFYPWKG